MVVVAAAAVVDSVVAEEGEAAVAADSAEAEVDSAVAVEAAAVDLVIAAVVVAADPCVEAVVAGTETAPIKRTIFCAKPLEEKPQMSPYPTQLFKKPASHQEQEHLQSLQPQFITPLPLYL